MDCEDVIPIENLDSCPSDEVAAGISEVGVYASPVRDFLVIAAPKDLKTAVTNEELAKIAEAHTFKEGKGFHKVAFIPDTGMVETAHVGEKGNLSFQNSLGGQLKGTGAKTAGYLRRYKNEAMIYIVRERNGDVKQIGSELSPAYLIETAATSGQKAGDIKGTTVKFQDNQNYPAPEYAGTIQEFPAPAPV